MPDMFDTGMAVRRAVLGDTHVDGAEATKSDFDLPFQTLITEGAWGGTAWADDSISRRELIGCFENDEDRAGDQVMRFEHAIYGRF